MTLAALRNYIDYMQCSHHHNSKCTQSQSSLRATKTTRHDRVHDARLADDARDRQPSADRLGKRRDVGMRAELLHGEERARSPRACLYLVGDERDAVRVAQRAQTTHERRCRCIESTFTLHL